MTNEINRVGIGNIRDRSLGAWRFARLSHSVCGESMCFEIPLENQDYCGQHKNRASQPEKKLKK